MSIYNSTIGELQSFVMQPLLLPILRVINLQGLLKIERYSKCWFCRSGHNCLTHLTYFWFSDNITYVYV